MSIAPNNHSISPSSRQALIDTIEAYIAREQLSCCAFGAAALGDASFLGRLGRGSDVRLGTADRVLAYMNLEPIGPRFLREIEAFLKVTGIKPHILGEQALGDPSFVLRLARGRSPTLGTIDRVGAWIADNASAAELEAVRTAVEDGAMAVPADAEGHEERELNETARYMTTPQAAAYLGLSPRTLESYRCRGGGPPYYVLGSVVRYLLSDLVRWASARRRRSTSDDGLRTPKDGDEAHEGEGEEEGEEDEGEDEDDGADGPGRARR